MARLLLAVDECAQHARLSAFFPPVVNRGVDLLGTDRSTQFSIAERTQANEVMPTLLEEIGADQPVEDDCR